MKGDAARFAFAGNGFLAPDAERLMALAAELEDPAWREALEGGEVELEADYVRLFFNPSGTPCPPWQSAHSVEKRLMGEPHLQALEWYRRFGVEPLAAHEPADHVGLLLLFYARLLDSAGPGEAAAFSAAHLGWIPAFCDAVESHARHPFYRLLAGRTRDLCRCAQTQL